MNSICGPGRFGMLLVGTALIGCGTSLAVREIPPPDSQVPMVVAAGVVTNSRSTYIIKSVEWKHDFSKGAPTVITNLGKLPMALPERPLVGIDANHLLSVDYSRQPFASGNLKVEVDKQQVPKSLTITSSSGAAALFNSAATVVETSSEVHKTLNPTTTTEEPQ